MNPFLISWQLFTSVFGVGPKTAEKWYHRGLRSFGDILAEPSIQLNRMQQSGMSTSHHLYSSIPLIIEGKIHLAFRAKKNITNRWILTAVWCQLGFCFTYFILVLFCVCALDVFYKERWQHQGIHNWKQNNENSRGYFEQNPMVIVKWSPCCEISNHMQYAFRIQQERSLDLFFLIPVAWCTWGIRLSLVLWRVCMENVKMFPENYSIICRLFTCMSVEMYFFACLVNLLNSNSSGFCLYYLPTSASNTNCAVIVFHV